MALPVPDREIQGGDSRRALGTGRAVGTGIAGWGSSGLGVLLCGPGAPSTALAPSLGLCEALRGGVIFVF